MAASAAVEAENGANDDGSTSVFVYTGVEEIPVTVTHLKVNYSVKVIQDLYKNYDHNHWLTRVELPEGLETIGDNAFCGCYNLQTISIPSTVNRIGRCAFLECVNLNEIELPQGLVTLGAGAFCLCVSLRSIRIPPLIQTIEVMSFAGCMDLYEVVLPEALQVIQVLAFAVCESLASIDFPSSLKVIQESSFAKTNLTDFNLPDSVETCGAFDYCTVPNLRMPPLITKFDAGNTEGCTISLELPENTKQIIINTNCNMITQMRNIAFPKGCKLSRHCSDSKKLMQRFDGLPIHKICYYHSYRDVDANVRDLRHQIHPWSTKTRRGKMNDVGRYQDFRGMTPLHILACSAKQDLRMYQIVVESYPENLVVEDQFGGIPLLYAFWFKASSEIIEFLVKSYKTHYPTYVFKWEGMIDDLIRQRAPLSSVRLLFETYRLSFPDQQEFVLENVIFTVASEPLNATITSLRFLLLLSMKKRLKKLNVRRWTLILREKINKCQFSPSLEGEIRSIYSILDNYELKKEAAILLELALWKNAFTCRFFKKPRTRYCSSYREHRRFNCGADIVIPNVLPFL